MIRTADPECRRTIGLGGLVFQHRRHPDRGDAQPCLLYTSDAADERSSVDLGGRRIIKKKKKTVVMHTQINYTDEDTRKHISTTQHQARARLHSNASNAPQQEQQHRVDNETT